ncbi:MAG TPA: hypothetical protein VLH09_10235 [Bryobacteraceae bacterium]|nr:hypothetical protein [Bryobacteraceae bacterium]
MLARRGRLAGDASLAQLKDLKRGTMASIIEQSGHSTEESLKLL